MSLSEELDQIYEEANRLISSSVDEADLDKNKNEFLGKKGKLTSVLKNLASLSIEEKKTVGQKANDLSKSLEEIVVKTRENLKLKSFREQSEKEWFDALRPLGKAEPGTLHPITKIQYEIEDIFTSMGFEVWDGPEVETDFNNFGALNFTDDHPARDMQDTFYLEDGNLLRTHTSAIQVRALRKLKPPFKIIGPGRVFRYEEVDASHETSFYQIEGMVVGKDISAGNMLYTMEVLLSRVFEKEVKTRLRPGFFPFVEPAFELDINCQVCGGSGCSVCKHSGWLELMPCGLVHPNVFTLNGLDPKEWTGFAFGLGLDRLVMMKYGIHDIRYLHSGNLRFLKQF
ncbi:phenylalanine--tRNA ligase subunit alpha [Leptospira wolffii]|uniref:phenylalanine--tRNA ligase subunit alpha n=1 Tax=Leptospira wolffii TaxID=409998 RepID=UPI0010838AB9|nr:phenylalanine--tRNA ligase subunit alpha [Leptospira wolffii]TGK61695.1 phenylalanine--tRNA ligase subunit alpha [Leptospira wolffii]TGK70238.1 phenylalanine--tRNA ligase subunit alpha [Leptospira wolffii]TGK77161.1 phenylalanine--tRNA ligase subunit alpha [Leptospira wolffii]TGL30986.1 phenylalanine--tRNA ligase subunit alpha [Leptospira wolffii]